MIGFKQDLKRMYLLGFELPLDFGFSAFARGKIVFLQRLILGDQAFAEQVRIACLHLVSPLLRVS